MSVVLTVIVLLVLTKEYMNFEGLSVTKNLYLDPNPIEEKLRVKLNVLLRHAPCAILSLDQTDDLSHHLLDIGVPKMKIDQSGKVIEKVN